MKRQLFYSALAAFALALCSTLVSAQTTYTNLDDVPLYGNWQHPPCIGPSCAGGTGTASQTNQSNGITNPAINGDPSMEIQLSAPSGVLSSGQTTNVLWPYKVGANNSLLYFQGTYAVYLPSLSNIQALEYDMFQFTGTRYMFGSECDTGAYWRIWNQLTSSWVATTAPCNLTAGIWHTIQWNVHRDPAGTNLCSGHPCLYYDRLTVDNVAYGPFASQPTTTSSDPNNVGIQFQIDQNYLGGTSVEYLNEIDFETALGIVANPTFSPSAGTYSSAQNVTISSSTPGATICYTLNGIVPTESGNACTGASFTYTGPVTVGVTETLQALATESGYIDSGVSSAAYTINIMNTPYMIPSGGTYGTPQTVYITETTPGATVCYTTDDSIPTETSNACTGTSTTYTGSPFVIRSNTTVNALATESGFTDSQIGSATYIITGSAGTLTTPTFSPPGGSYGSAQSVTISSNAGALICWALAPTVPTEINNVCSGSSNGYVQGSSAPVSVPLGSTINAIATLAGYTDSAMGSATYTIASLVPVQATLTDGSGGIVGGKLYLHFVLWNCGANTPVNAQTSAIVKRSFDIVANSSGVATGTVVPNDEITCGNVVSTQWTVSVMSSENAPITQAQNYYICSAGAVGQTCAQPTPGAAFNIANAQPASFSPPAPGFIPLFINPVVTQTLTQPGGTQLNLDGLINFPNGFQVGGSAPLGDCLIGNGTYFLPSTNCGSGGGGGSGTVTSVSGTANQITVVNNTTTPVISIATNPTIPGNETITGTDTVQGGTLTVQSSAAGTVQLGGGTSNPTLNTNSTGFIAPSSASFTSYFFQFPTTAPTSGQFLTAGTPSGNIIPLAYASSGSGGNPTLDNCTTDQSGNSFYNVTSLTNVYYASWAFVFGQASYIDCQVHVTGARSGDTITLVIAANDSTSGHTANFQTCDVFWSSSTINVGSLTCASNQTFTTTSTAYNGVTLTFNVQSTISGAGTLLVKIATSTTGTAPTANLLVYPTFQ